MNWRWFARRLVSVAVVLFVCSLVTYLLLDALPGSTAASILGQGATKESIATVEADLRLNDPLPLRYATWLGRAARGDLGVSYQTGEVVAVSLRDRLPTSLELVIFTQLAAIAIALPAAMASARREHSRIDRSLSSVAFGAVALPQFAFGIVLLIVFAQKLGWFPVADYKKFSDSPGGNLRSLVLPVATLAVPLAGIYYRVLRTDLVQTLRSDHITFARALGFSPQRVLYSRALRSSSLTLASVVGLNTAFLLGGTVIVERMYSMPGLGGFLFQAILTRDVVKVQGATLLVALIYVLVNLGVDVVLTMLDPRIRLAGDGE
jgi:peptide/nickel transport system permease protein